MTKNQEICVTEKDIMRYEKTKAEEGKLFGGKYVCSYLEIYFYIAIFYLTFENDLGISVECLDLHGLCIRSCGSLRAMES